MNAVRASLLLGGIPVVVGLLYLVLQVALGDPATWVSADGDVFSAAGDIVAMVTGTMDPAGVLLLVALGVSMGFGMLVILRGARDL